MQGAGRELLFHPVKAQVDGRHAVEPLRHLHDLQVDEVPKIRERTPLSLSNLVAWTSPPVAFKTSIMFPFWSIPEDDGLLLQGLEKEPENAEGRFAQLFVAKFGNELLDEVFPSLGRDDHEDADDSVQHSLHLLGILVETYLYDLGPIIRAFVI